MTSYTTISCSTTCACSETMNENSCKREDSDYANKSENSTQQKRTQGFQNPKVFKCISNRYIGDAGLNYLKGSYR